MPPKQVRLLFVDETARAFVAHLLTEKGFEVVHQSVDEEGNLIPIVAEANFLTPTEQRVLQALADHGSTKAAARDCGVSPSTVKKHLENLRKKLGVATRVQLVAEGFRLKLLR